MTRENCELSDAKKMTEKLAWQVVQFRVKARTRRKEIDRLKKHSRGDEEWALTNVEVGSAGEYLELFRELQATKLELSNMKLEMASALEEKKKAEKEVQALQSRMDSDVLVMEELEKQIEATNEEHMLVELSRVEASREYTDLRTLRKVEKETNSMKLEEAKAKRMDLIKEIKCAEGVETKLVVTTSDLQVLQNEMVFIRGMSKNLRSNRSLVHNSKKEGVDTESSHLLQTAKAELDAAKKELASIKEEGFRFMSSMDVARKQLKQTTGEVSRLKMLVEEEDAKLQYLHSNLLKAKSKLEAASAADRKSKAISFHLLSTIECSRNDAERSQQEHKKITEEIDRLKSQTDKNNAYIDATRKKLLEAVHVLQEAKASESLVLERLRVLSENAMQLRDSPGAVITKITISHGEHEYLRKGAEGAKELAVKKVEAAQAWVTALGNSQKEALFQTEIVRKEIQEIKELEQKEVPEITEALPEKGEQIKRRQLEKEAHHSHMATPQFKLTAPRKTLKQRKSMTYRRKSISPDEALEEEIVGLFDVTVLDGENQQMELQKLKSLQEHVITQSSTRSISSGQALTTEAKDLSEVTVLEKESQLVDLQKLKFQKVNANSRSSRKSITHTTRPVFAGQTLVAEIEEMSDDPDVTSVPAKESQVVELQQHRTVHTRKSISSSRKSLTRRRSSISGNRVLPRSPTVVIRKRRKVITNLFKFIRERRAGNSKLECS